MCSKNVRSRRQNARRPGSVRVSSRSLPCLKPYSNLAATEAYIAGHPSDLLVMSQLCGYLIFYGGARKLERVLNIME